MSGKQTNLLGVDLFVDVGGPGVRDGLVAGLRDAIRNGRLIPGTTLPASRTLAADLGVSRSTVTECYSTLVAEGWLTARQGSGTRVAPTQQPSGTGAPSAVQGSPPPRPRNTGLVPGAPEFADFPRQAWLTAARRALATAPVSAFGYGDALGAEPLRVALSEYLGRARGVRARPDQIVVCAGFHEGLQLVGRALHRRGTRSVAVESYGLGLYRDLLRRLGLSIPALPVDAHGADTGALDGLGAGAVLVTPAHQFPTGVALSPERRAAVRDWARTTGGFVLEDDYDGEFRYDRTPVGALQGLDPDRVVYFGTASKSIAPGLRLGWIVVPDDLLADVRAERGPVDVVSAVDQVTLAEFIRSGAFDRHVRMRRTALRRRQAELVARLAEALPSARVTGLAAGLQAVVEVPAAAEPMILAEAGRRGVRLSRIADFRHPEVPPAGERSGLVVNYASISDSAWPASLALLADVVGLAVGLEARIT